MAAQIVKLNTRRQRVRAEQAAQLRQLVLEFDGLDADAAGRIVAAIDRETAAQRKWPFVMISPAQNVFVVSQLTTRSARPQMAARLWAELFLHLRLDTGELVVTREELAAAVGTHPNNISAIMGELARMRAVVRKQEGRQVRWFLNPLVGTGMSGAVREKAQAAAPQLRALEGGKASAE